MYTTTLEAFLGAHFPGLKLLVSHDSNHVEVILPEDPKRVAAEVAVDEAWEINR